MANNPNYFTTVKMSGPIITAAKPDIDMGGIGFSYTIGWCFPTSAAVPSPVRPPATPPQSKSSRSGGPGVS
jgi:hypothetical protein